MNNHSIKHLLHFILLFSIGTLALYFLTDGFVQKKPNKSNNITQIDAENKTFVITRKKGPSIEFNPTQLLLENARTFYYDEEAKHKLGKIIIKSAKAVPRETEIIPEDIFEVEEPKITIFREGFKDNNLGDTTITADRGELNKEYSKGLLHGNVVIRTEDPKGKKVTIRTQSLSIDIEGREISTKDKVTINAEQLNLEGVGLSAGLNINEAIIYSDVKLTLKNLSQNYFEESELLGGKSTSNQEKEISSPENYIPINITCADKAILRRKEPVKDPSLIRHQQTQDIQVSFYEKVMVTRGDTKFYCDQLDLNAVYNKSSKKQLDFSPKFYNPNATSNHFCGLHACKTHGNEIFCEAFEKSLVKIDSPAGKIKPVSLYGTGNVKVFDEKGTASANKILWFKEPSKKVQTLRLEGDPSIDFAFDKKLSFLEVESKQEIEPEEGKALLRIRCKDYLEYHLSEDKEDKAYFVGDVVITRNAEGKELNRLEAEMMELNFRRISETKIDIDELIASNNVYIKELRGEVRSDKLIMERRSDESFKIKLLGPSKLRFKTEQFSLKAASFFEGKKETEEAKEANETKEKELQIIEAQCEKELVFEQIDSAHRRFYLEKEVKITRYLPSLPKQRSILLCDALDCFLTGEANNPKRNLQLEQFFAKKNIQLLDFRGNVACEEMYYSKDHEELVMLEQVKISGEQGKAYCNRFNYNMKTDTGVLEGDEKEKAKLLQTSLVEGKKLTNTLQGNRIKFNQKNGKLVDLFAGGNVHAKIYPKGEMKESFLPKHLASKVSHNKNAPWIVDCDKLKVLFDPKETKEKQSENSDPRPSKIIAAGNVHIQSQDSELKEVKGDYFFYDATKDKVKVKSKEKYKTILRQGNDYLKCKVFSYDHKTQQATCEGGTKTTFTHQISLSKNLKKNSSKAKKPSPIYISCKKPLVYSGRSNKIVFEEKVKVILKNDNVEFRANKIIVILNEKQEPTKIKAFGNVRAIQKSKDNDEQKELAGNGDQAIWDVKDQIGYLIGKVELRQGTKTAKGEQLVWESKRERAILTGNPAKLSKNIKAREYLITPEIIFYPEQDKFKMPYSFEMRVLPKGIEFLDRQSKPKNKKRKHRSKSSK